MATRLCKDHQGDYAHYDPCNCTVCSLLYALQQIIGDLPANRDWLDPNIERMAKDAIAKAVTP
jgi:hypothetical protein